MVYCASSGKFDFLQNAKVAGSHLSGSNLTVCCAKREVRKYVNR